jgi:protein SCO1/2
MNSIENNPATRRGILGALLATGATGVAAATGARMVEPVRPAGGLGLSAEQQQSRERLRKIRTPNELLVDHNGRSVRFYDDIMKNRKVVINVMYTVCSNICTPATRHLIEAQRLLGDEAKDIHFVSMSLTPLSDDPAALREYKKLHGIDERWTFLTGKVENVERVQRAMGFLSERDTDDLLSHSGMARLCDEPNVKWTHLNTMVSGKSIARMIRFEMA